MQPDKELYLKYRIQKALETAEDARIALGNGRFRNALNRIYYAMFYFVSALALKDNYSTSRHGQLMGWFNQKYIKTGILPKEIGKIYLRAFESRQESDYKDMILYEENEIRVKYDEMIIFIEKIKELLKVD